MASLSQHKGSVCKATIRVAKLEKQLASAKDTIARLRAEQKSQVEEMSSNLDIYEQALANAKATLKRVKPLHRQCHNLYIQRRALWSQVRALREEVELYHSKVSKKNLSLLAKVAAASK